MYPLPHTPQQRSLGRRIQHGGIVERRASVSPQEQAERDVLEHRAAATPDRHRQRRGDEPLQPTDNPAKRCAGPAEDQSDTKPTQEDADHTPTGQGGADTGGGPDHQANKRTNDEPKGESPEETVPRATPQMTRCCWPAVGSQEGCVHSM